MTQQELADDAGVDIKTVYNLESGQRWPISKNRAALAVALRWEPDALAVLAAGEEPLQMARAVPYPSASPAPAASRAPVIDRASGIQPPAQHAETMTRYLDEIEGRLVMAAMTEAGRRGVPVDDLLDESPDGFTWTPDGAAVFPDQLREAGWWDGIKAVGDMDRPASRTQVAKAIAVLRIRHAVEQQQEPGGTGTALAAPCRDRVRAQLARI